MMSKMRLYLLDGRAAPGQAKRSLMIVKPEVDGWNVIPSAPQAYGAEGQIEAIRSVCGCGIFGVGKIHVVAILPNFNLCVTLLL
jgi:hypothetical protein